MMRGWGDLTPSYLRRRSGREMGGQVILLLPTFSLEECWNDGRTGNLAPSYFLSRELVGKER